MLKKLYSICICMLLAFASGYAQELNCKVILMHDKISGVDPQVFATMQRSLNDFMNSHKWTNDDFGVAEKIDCNFQINLLSRISGDNDGYTASLNIQATRPVYN